MPPTANSHFATKGYVDSALNQLKGSVTTITMTSPVCFVVAENNKVFTIKMPNITTHYNITVDTLHASGNWRCGFSYGKVDKYTIGGGLTGNYNGSDTLTLTCSPNVTLTTYVVCYGISTYT